jgi:hypothetical protein
MQTRNLPVELTKDEIRLRGEELARKHAEWDEVENARKTAQTEAKGKIERIEAESKLLANNIRTGREYRDIEVREVRNDTTLSMDLVRQDTGEVIESRPLRTDELQTTIFDISKSKKKNEA